MTPSPVSQTSGEAASGPAMAGEPPRLDEEEVRTTAYFLWEADGRPEGNGEHYWWAAVEKIARAKAADLQIDKPPSPTR